MGEQHARGPAGEQEEPVIAVALSIVFPGLGQLYYGKWGRAIAMILLESRRSIR